MQKLRLNDPRICSYCIILYHLALRECESVNQRQVGRSVEGELSQHEGCNSIMVESWEEFWWCGTLWWVIRNEIRISHSTCWHWVSCPRWMTWVSGIARMHSDVSWGVIIGTLLKILKTSVSFVVWFVSPTHATNGLSHLFSIKLFSIKRVDHKMYSAPQEQAKTTTLQTKKLEKI